MGLAEILQNQEQNIHNVLNTALPSATCLLWGIPVHQKCLISELYHHTWAFVYKSGRSQITHVFQLGLQQI